MIVRWNAAYKMFQRISEQEEAINNFAIQQKKFDMLFDADESEFMHELIKLLEPLEQLTRIFCSNTSSISVKVPFGKMTQKKLSELQFKNDDVRNLRDKMAEDLQTKFYVFENNKLNFNLSN